MDDVYTYRDRVERISAMTAAAWAEAIARYRKAHPEATATDKAIRAVLTIEALAGRSPEQTPSPQGGEPITRETAERISRDGP